MSSLSKYIFLLYILCFGTAISAQEKKIEIDKTVEECEKASAVLRIQGFKGIDSLSTTWSTGEINSNQVRNLLAGDYSVHVKFIFKDTLRQEKDTTLFFTIEKERCPLSIPRYFSPNDDGYNDLLMIARIENYPNFEFIVYNKMGQRVHHQEKNFQPWDGRWLGVNLPDATYYYIVFYDKQNPKEYIKGDLTILR